MSYNDILQGVFATGTLEALRSTRDLVAKERETQMPIELPNLSRCARHQLARSEL
jgi:hypothetical protein